MAMLFQKLNSDSADKVFITCKNGLTSRIAIGTPVCFDSVTDNNGNTVITPTTASLRLFAGIVSDRIMGTSGQPDQYQKVQVYGYNPAILMGATSVTPGIAMQIANGLTYLRPAILHSATTAAEIDETYAYVVAGTTYNTPAATYIATKPGYIRAM
jgi:hypothetical protein